MFDLFLIVSSIVIILISGSMLVILGTISRSLNEISSKISDKSSNPLMSTINSNTESLNQLNFETSKIQQMVHDYIWTTLTTEQLHNFLQMRANNTASELVSNPIQKSIVRHNKKTAHRSEKITI